MSDFPPHLPPPANEAPFERCAGLVHGFLFRGKNAIALSDETLAAALSEVHDWFWLHLALSDHRARRFVNAFAAMPEAARALMLGPEDRIQLHLTPTGAWGILPDIERDFAGESLGIARISFWLDETRLITARHHPVRATENLRGAIDHGDAPGSTSEALAMHQALFIALLEKRISAMSRDLDRIEDAMLADRENGGTALGPLRRELSRYAREFSALRSAIHRATSARHAATTSPLLTHLPLILQEAEDFERDAGTLLDRARLLYEELETRIASRTNRSLSALTVISTLLLPPTFVVGAFGMNVQGIPWAAHSYGFVYVFGLCIILVGAGYGVLRRFGILP